MNGRYVDLFLFIFCINTSIYGQVKEIKVALSANRRAVLNVTKELSTIDSSANFTWLLVDNNKKKKLFKSDNSRYSYSKENPNLIISPVLLSDIDYKFTFELNNKTKLQYIIMAISEEPSCQTNLNSNEKHKKSLVSVNSGEIKELYCSVDIRKRHHGWFDISSDDDVNFSWYILAIGPNKMSKIKLNSSSNRLSLTVKNITINQITFPSRVLYTAPNNSLDAWQHNNQELFCEISYTGVDYSEIDNQTCSFGLNLLFEPFIHPNVSSTQSLANNSQSYLECPIKAPYMHPFYSYYIAWYYRLTPTSEWIFQYGRSYDASASFYIIEHVVNENVEKREYKCELYKLNNKINKKSEFFIDNQMFDSNQKQLILSSIINVTNPNPTSYGNLNSLFSNSSSSPQNLTIVILFIVFVTIMALAVVTIFRIYDRKRRRITTAAIHTDVNKASVCQTENLNNNNRPSINIPIKFENVKHSRQCPLFHSNANSIPMFRIMNKADLLSIRSLSKSSRNKILNNKDININRVTPSNESESIYKTITEL